MRIGIFNIALASAVFLLLAGCGGFWDIEERERWRAREEAQCLASGDVKRTPFIRPSRAISGPGICGIDHPFEVTALQGGQVAFSNSATMSCGHIRETEDWLSESVQPAAMAIFGSPVSEMKIAASYSCRGRNGAAKGPLSEHAFANALDISSFKLADGREITVEGGWGDIYEGAFLRNAHSGACERFSTVLGPEADRHHRDHFHLDLARHGRYGDHRVCQ
ncbi:extensin family protein [Rhizobiales bacterium]|uniref:extensin-like domain-containing protein n=1 Tax=Hongsoonwoonella zoysiae TaxID=2821844 RepID=UPI001560BE4C|nr:extensin family protein [Hongsoonwoonella zoysiae]NRG17807.1 extensin family protein [Hongsoonwoonella zoysiae]